MARIFVREASGYEPGTVIVGDKLPSKSSGDWPNAIILCSGFAKDLGIASDDRKGRTIVEYELTVKEVARYALQEESPWKPIKAS